MKHVARISAARPGRPAAMPERADAKTDFLTAVYNAWVDFVYQKKNELTL